MANPFDFTSVAQGNELGVDRVSQLTQKEIDALKAKSLEGESTIGHDQAPAKEYLQKWAAEFGGLIGQPKFISRPWKDQDGQTQTSFFLQIPFKEKTVSVRSAGTGTLVNELMTMTLDEAKEKVMSSIKDETLQIAFFLKDRAEAQRRNGGAQTARGGVTGDYQFFIGAEQQSVEMDLSDLFDVLPSDVNVNDVDLNTLTVKELKSFASDQGIDLGNAKSKAQIISLLESEI